MTISTQFLEDRIDDLKHQITLLENSDERLFSNGNGNLNHYNDLQKELREHQDRLVQIRCDT